MRAICVLKTLLLVGLVVDAGTALAVEDLTQGRSHGPVQELQAIQGRQFERQFHNRASGTDLFATDRSAVFAAAPVTASGQFTSGSFALAAPFTVKNAGGDADEGFTALEQQRNIILLQQRIAAARMRSAGDGWLMALIGLMLVAYQLCRKHRFLRPQPFAL